MGQSLLNWGDATSHFAFAHLAVENVLVEEALALVPVRIPEHDVPLYPAVLKLAVENISVLISVREAKEGNLSRLLVVSVAAEATKMAG